MEDRRDYAQGFCDGYKQATDEAATIINSQNKYIEVLRNEIEVLRTQLQVKYNE